MAQRDNNRKAKIGLELDFTNKKGRFELCYYTNEQIHGYTAMTFPNICLRYEISHSSVKSSSQGERMNASAPFTTHTSAQLAVESGPERSDYSWRLQRKLGPSR